MQSDGGCGLQSRGRGERGGLSGLVEPGLVCCGLVCFSVCFRSVVDRIDVLESEDRSNSNQFVLLSYLSATS